MSIENDYLNDEDYKGSATDKHGNTLSWQAHPDEGFMDISVNGEELISYCYESDPEPVFNEFVTIWEKAQKCMGSPAVSNQDQIAKLEATVRQLTDDKYRLLREIQSLKGLLRTGAEPPLFVYEMSELINAQDNRITADPLFCVFQKRTIVVDEDYDYDRIVWADGEGNEASDTETEKLNKLRADVDGDYCAENEIEWDSVEWRRLAIKEIDEFVTACFTEQGCKDFLATQGHNLYKPFTYVTSLFRNIEMIQLRNWIAGMAKQGPQS